MAQKSTENLVEGVMRSKEIPFERVLFALGIRFVGETVAKKLAKHFKSIDALMSATFEVLITVDEIGDRIAESVIAFFKIPTQDLFSEIPQGESHREVIERLREYGLQLAISEEELAGQTDKLSGAIFVVSGVFTKVSRTELKKLIEDNGGKVSGSISKKTRYVVAGDSMGPSKRTKAEDLGVSIISEDDFLAMIAN
jgi:DNA ligase (NAD+)